MNFYVIVGFRSNATVHALRLDKAAQDDLSEVFESLSDDILKGDHVAFEPGYRADEGEILTVSSYELPSGLSALASSDRAAELPAVAEQDVEGGAVRGLVGVDWKANSPRLMAFQRIDSSHVLRRESRRLMLAGGRFVRDERPGIEVADRVDAVLRASSLYVSNWSRAHAVLDLSAWVREATVAETETFVQQSAFALEDGFDIATIADTWVRRKVASISRNGVIDKATPRALREYAAKFDLTIEVKKNRIVLPADKKAFKRVLSLLDEDFLSFAPTDERWVVNSKRRANADA